MGIPILFGSPSIHIVMSMNEVYTALFKAPHFLPRIKQILSKPMMIFLRNELSLEYQADIYICIYIYKTKKISKI